MNTTIHHSSSFSLSLPMKVGGEKENLRPSKAGAISAIATGPGSGNVAAVLIVGCNDNDDNEASDGDW